MSDITRPRTPWHEGEITLQKRFGSFDNLAVVGPRFIRNRMPEQHRDFFQRLPFLTIGTVDGDGLPWASILGGTPGFVGAEQDDRLDIAAMLARDDPARGGLVQGNPVGLLGIDFATRRRNRMNGDVVRIDEKSLAVQVEHSFGNCPKYIQLRQWEPVDGPTSAPSTAQSLASLDNAARALIETADTFFVASYAETAPGTRQVDISHRGGKPGFVRIDTDDRLTIPDFAGNRFFNTLGNILASEKAGLLFIDFMSGALLQVSGTAELIEDGHEIARYAGAERLWRVWPERIVRRSATLGLRWKIAAAPTRPSSPIQAAGTALSDSPLRSKPLQR